MASEYHRRSLWYRYRRWRDCQRDIGWCSGRRVHGSTAPCSRQWGRRVQSRGAGGPTLVEYSFIEKLGTKDGSHADGNQTRGGSNITFRYNNIWMPSPGTSNYPGSPYKSNAAAMHCCGISDLVYEYNWLNGGNYTVYCQTSGENVSGIRVRNNLFGRDYNFGVKSGTCDEWSGNRWKDTLEPI